VIKHKHRLIGLVVFALVEAAVLLLPAFDVLDADTASTAAQAILGVLVTLGIVDAGLIEARRRDPSIPALPDDVRDEKDGSP
jgi:hypothetical protein